MGRVALPEMKRFKYDDALATGTVASGGTLGFIFPPSAGMVIYAVLTEQALGRLFLAGVIPGIILTLLFLVVIRIITARRVEAGPPGPRATRAERIATLKQASGIIIIIVMTIGGMYAGLFTPIEASGFGAGFTMVLALLRRRLNWPVLRAVVLQTMRTSATIFLILMGAYVFIPFMFSSLIQTTPFIKSGQLKALGTGGAKRTSVLPDVPTISEAGVPGYVADNWWGLAAPAGLPAPLLDRLYKASQASLKAPELQAQFEREGAATVTMTTAEFGDYIKAEIAKWGRVVKEGNITAQ